MSYEKLKGIASLKKGESLPMLAEAIGVNYSTLYRQIKSGKLTIRTVKLIVEHLGMNNEETREVFFNA